MGYPPAFGVRQCRWAWPALMLLGTILLLLLTYASTVGAQVGGVRGQQMDTSLTGFGDGLFSSHLLYSYIAGPPDEPPIAVDGVYCYALKVRGVSLPASAGIWIGDSRLLDLGTIPVGADALTGCVGLAPGVADSLVVPERSLTVRVANSEHPEGALTGRPRSGEVRDGTDSGARAAGVIAAALSPSSDDLARPLGGLSSGFIRMAAGTAGDLGAACYLLATSGELGPDAFVLYAGDDGRTVAIPLQTPAPGEVTAVCLPAPGVLTSDLLQRPDRYIAMVVGPDPPAGGIAGRLVR